MKSVTEGLKWRYAINKFDIEKKLSEEQLVSLLDAMILTPSSFGLQPWKFIVVTNPEIRTRLQEAGYSQPKISEASHLIVIAVEKHIDDALVEKYMQSISEIRNVPRENLNGYADMIKGTIVSKQTDAARVEWATKQAYIALGVLVTAGAVEGIDVAPMEGFDPQKFDEILGLDKLNLESKVIAAVGFRAPDDPVSQMKKVRYSKEEVGIERK
ncbi:NAD(P)H-dependent oxidoreductase [soil metagenome]